MNQRAAQMFAKHEAVPGTKVRVGVGVVVRDQEGRILMEQRSDCGLWGLPGGALDPGESLTECAVREVKEETGLDVEVTGLIGVYSEPHDRIVTYLDNGDVVHVIDAIVEARVWGGELCLSHESLKMEWFDPEKIPTDLAPPARVTMADVVAGRSCVLR